MKWLSVFIAAMLLCAPVRAHDNYPAWCCNGDGETGDCKNVACDSITETDTGYEWAGIHFTPKQTFPSFDKQCHACAQKGGAPMCLFILPSS
jgi:hypothetical protein